MSFCQLVPIVILASTIVGGLVASLIGTRILYGMALGTLIGLSPLLLLGLLVGLMQLWRSEYPRCLCGHRNYDYVTMVKTNANDPDTWVFRYRCLHCGREFSSSGNAFEVMGENGLLQPHMTHSLWGRWRPAGG